MATTATAVKRLSALRDLTAQYGSRLVVAMPPTVDQSDSSTPEAFRRAGRATGVAVLWPSEFASIPEADFYDGFHVDEHGAAIYTPCFIAALKAELASPRPAPDRIALDGVQPSREDKGQTP